MKISNAGRQNIDLPEIICQEAGAGAGRVRNKSWIYIRLPPKLLCLPLILLHLPPELL